MNVAHATLQNNWIYLIFFSVLSQIKVKADFVCYFFFFFSFFGYVIYCFFPPHSSTDKNLFCFTKKTKKPQSYLPRPSRLVLIR